MRGPIKNYIHITVILILCFMNLHSIEKALEQSGATVPTLKDLKQNLCDTNACQDEIKI